MHRPSTLLLAGVSALLLALPGCGGERAATPSDGTPAVARSGESAAVEEWRLTPEPLVEIGVREGEEPYQLDRVGGSVLLEDGRIVVLNGGSRQLRYYDSEGRYQRSVGHEGDGPGEFRWPTGLRRSADGGLQVWDGSLMRVSWFDVEGGFQRSEPLMATSARLFPGDDWIQGANWVTAPVAPGARAPIQRAVDALPPPDSTGTLRVVQVTPQGRLWVPRERTPADRPVTWDVYDLQGRAVARLETPARFRPQEIGPDHVTGVFLDEVDVNYVRVYGLEKPEGSLPGPGLVAGAEAPDAGAAPARPAPPEEVLAEIRSLVKNMASLEEIHYSQHFTYTTDTDELFSGPGARIPEGLGVEILFANSQGWAGRVSHSESGAACVLAYGMFVPMGWQPGAVICL